MDGPQRPGVCFLGQVLGVGWLAQIAAQPEDVREGFTDEVIQRLTIPSLGAQRDSGESIHNDSQPRWNQNTQACDYVGVECDSARAGISVVIDEGTMPSPELQQHLDGCADCRAWQDRAHRLRRSTLRSVSDNAHTAIELSRLPDRFRLHRWLRFALAWTGVLLIGWNLVDMFAPGSGTAIHLERHQAAFSVALGFAFLFVAWRPDRAYGMVPFAATFTLALSISALIDLANGASTLLRESLHLVELAGLGMLWVLGLAAGPRRTRPADPD